LIYGDATPEAQAWGLANNWPSGGVLSSEAGAILGSHAMNAESQMRNLAILNLLWDGSAQTFDRRKEGGSFRIDGARFTVGLQVQEPTLRSFFVRTGELARGTGFLARFLVTCPDSTQGSRPFTDAPPTWPALSAFHGRTAAILSNPPPINPEGGLCPTLLTMTPEAKAAWVAYHDAIEVELRAGGELCDVRDVASKSADNAARLAALFHVFEYGTVGAIDADLFQSASRIAAWYLSESRRFFGELALSADVANAARLDAWLVGYCRRDGTDRVPRREVQRHVTPTRLRHKAALSQALIDLADAGRVRQEVDGKRKDILVHPRLLEGDPP
jgi:putative DNA primase/helicase